MKLLKTMLTTMLLLIVFSATSYAAWSAAVQITANDVEDINPKIAVENGNLHMVFMRLADQNSSKGSLHYIQKPSGKQTWSSPSKIASNSNVGEIPVLSTVDLAVYNNKAYAAYMIDDGDKEIAFKTNRSGAWPSIAKKLTANTAYDDTEPAIAQENGKLYVVFARKKIGDTKSSQIYFTKNTSGTWTKPVKISDDRYLTVSPSIFVKNGKIHVAWTSTDTASEGAASSLKYKYFLKGKWSSIRKVIGDSSKIFLYPEITVFKSKVCISYMSADTSKLSANINFSYFSEGQWKKRAVTGNTGPSLYADVKPHMSANNGRLGLIWTRVLLSGDQPSSEVWHGKIDSLSAPWVKKNITGTPSLSEIANDFIIESTGQEHAAFYGANGNDPENADLDVYIQTNP